MARPTKYKAEYKDVLLNLMKEGAAIEEICLELDICVQTLYNWIEQHPEFLESKKKGESFSKGWWMREGRTNLENKDFNYTGWYMNMKNRFGWADRTQNESKVEVKQIDPSKYTDEELKYIAELQRKGGISE